MKKESKEIRQHNIITTARYEMSAIEMDLVFCLLSMLKPNNEDGLKYFIDVRELENITGRNWNYQQLQDATYKLNERVYQYQDDKKLVQFSILQSAEYLKGTGTIELMIAEKAKSFLLDLKE